MEAEAEAPPAELLAEAGVEAPDSEGEAGASGRAELEGDGDDADLAELEAQLYGGAREQAGESGGAAAAEVRSAIPPW